MSFWINLVLPIVILALSMAGVVFIINLVLRAIHFDVTIVRILAFFAIWYFVGPFIYNWMLSTFVTEEYEGLKILYMPIQYIYNAISKLV